MPMCLVGLIGFGRATKSRIKALSELGIKSLAVATPRSLELHHWLETASLDVEIEVYDSWRLLLQHCSASLVFICSASQNHSQQTKAALSACKHVSVEFPLTDNLQEAMELNALATSVKRSLHVECIGTLTPQHLGLKEKVASLGSNLTHYHSEFTGRLYRWVEEAARDHRWGLLSFGRLYQAVDLLGALKVISCSVTSTVQNDKVILYQISIDLQPVTHQVDSDSLRQYQPQVIKIEESRGLDLKRSHSLKVETAQGIVEPVPHMAMPLFQADTALVLYKSGLLDVIPDELKTPHQYSAIQIHLWTLQIIEEMKVKINEQQKVSHI